MQNRLDLHQIAGKVNLVIELQRNFQVVVRVPLVDESALVELEVVKQILRGARRLVPIGLDGGRLSRERLVCGLVLQLVGSKAGGE